MERIELRIAGTRPLIMNKMDPNTLLEIWRSQSASAGARQRKQVIRAFETPRDEADSKVHRLTNGDPCMTREAFMATLIEAGKFIKLDKRRQITNATASVLPGMIQLEPEGDFALVTTQDWKTPAKWEVDIRRGSTSDGTAVPLVRPRFDLWGFECSLLIDTDQISPNTIRELVDIAGSRVGLMCMRPGRKQTFGTFKVACWGDAHAQAAE